MESQKQFIQITVVKGKKKKKKQQQIGQRENK